MEITIVGAAAHLHLFTFLFKTFRKGAFKAFVNIVKLRKITEVSITKHHEALSASNNVSAALRW
jgi:hypothetical protein